MRVNSQPESSAKAYLLSPHPFVLEELSRWHPPPGITFEPVRLPRGQVTTAGSLVAEAGSVCVVDACFPLATTKSLISEILAGSPQVRVLAVVEELTGPVAFSLLRLGVKGILTYPEARSQLLPAIGAVARGGIWVPREILSSFLDGLLGSRPPLRTVPNAPGLSRREQDVLEALLQNLSNKEIGLRLNISERTVKFHVSNLLSKFAVQRRADLILQSLQPSISAG